MRPRGANARRMFWPKGPHLFGPSVDRQKVNEDKRQEVRSKTKIVKEIRRVLATQTQTNRH